MSNFQPTKTVFIIAAVNGLKRNPDVQDVDAQTNATHHSITVHHGVDAGDAVFNMMNLQFGSRIVETSGPDDIGDVYESNFLIKRRAVEAEMT